MEPRAATPELGTTAEPADGPEKERTIAEVLELLAQAIVQEIKGDSADDGPIPEGNEPYA